MRLMSATFAVLLGVATPCCILVDVERAGAPGAASEQERICSARHGGESDHLVGERWFDRTDWCTCVSLAGVPETRCRDTCADDGVRYSDTEGVVCRCDLMTRQLDCAADANDGECPCLCEDPDDDGICG
ncbi:MAG: hypothetical protein IT383_13465 [Deltaproteobacteria bacterium]|nr:hypothetical protein [Deltaproteobacteria bacterium]